MSNAVNIGTLSAGVDLDTQPLNRAARQAEKTLGDVQKNLDKTSGKVIDASKAFQQLQGKVGQTKGAIDPLATALGGLNGKMGQVAGAAQGLLGALAGGPFTLVAAGIGVGVAAIMSHFDALEKKAEESRKKAREQMEAWRKFMDEIQGLQGANSAAVIGLQGKAAIMAAGAGKEGSSKTIAEESKRKQLLEAENSNLLKQLAYENAIIDALEKQNNTGVGYQNAMIAREKIQAKLISIAGQLLDTEQKITQAKLDGNKAAKEAGKRRLEENKRRLEEKKRLDEQLESARASMVMKFATPLEKIEIERIEAIKQAHEIGMDELIPKIKDFYDEQVNKFYESEKKKAEAAKRAAIAADRAYRNGDAGAVATVLGGGIPTGWIQGKLNNMEASKIPGFSGAGMGAGVIGVMIEEFAGGFMRLGEKLGIVGDLVKGFIMPFTVWIDNVIGTIDFFQNITGANGIGRILDSFKVLAPDQMVNNSLEMNENFKKLNAGLEQAVQAFSGIWNPLVEPMVPLAGLFIQLSRSTSSLWNSMVQLPPVMEWLFEAVKGVGIAGLQVLEFFGNQEAAAQRAQLEALQYSTADSLIEFGDAVDRATESLSNMPTGRRFRNAVWAAQGAPGASTSVGNFYSMVGYAPIRDIRG